MQASSDHFLTPRLFIFSWNKKSGGSHGMRRTAEIPADTGKEAMEAAQNYGSN
jgi:hypothetical protein